MCLSHVHGRGCFQALQDLFLVPHHGAQGA